MGQWRHLGHPSQSYPISRDFSPGHPIPSCPGSPSPLAGVPLPQGAILANDVISIYLCLLAAPALLGCDCITITMVKSDDISLMTSGADWYLAFPLQEQSWHPIRRLGKELGVPHWFRGTV